MDQITYNPAAELTVLVNKLMQIVNSYKDSERSELCYSFYCDIQRYRDNISIEINNNRFALSETRFKEYIELLKLRTDPFRHFNGWLNFKEHRIKKPEDIFSFSDNVISKSHFGKYHKTILSQSDCAILVMASLYKIQEHCLAIACPEREPAELTPRQECLINYYKSEAKYEDRITSAEAKKRSTYFYHELLSTNVKSQYYIPTTERELNIILPYLKDFPNAYKAATNDLAAFDIKS